MKKDHVTVDAKYKSCPGPLIILVKSVKGLKAGSVVRLLATDPDALKDIEQWCSRTGHRYLGFEEKDGVLEIYVEVT
ncbi:MAG: sulfurtransferase TusA family protein [Thaumarchaeota archaeon]|nr:sulfurtransferase TusA family protein [Nitrososphaerota archaeon]